MPTGEILGWPQTAIVPPQEGCSLYHVIRKVLRLYKITHPLYYTGAYPHPWPKKAYSKQRAPQNEPECCHCRH